MYVLSLTILLLQLINNLFNKKLFFLQPVQKPLRYNFIYRLSLKHINVYFKYDMYLNIPSILI